MTTNVEELYKRYGPMVHRRCMRLLRSQEDAEDMTQEVFIRLLQSKSEIQEHGLSSYLWTIATNLCLNRIRDAKRRGEDCVGDELLVQIASVDDHGSRIDAQSLLGRLFGRHQASTREIAVLHFLDGMTYEEVAQAVGLSVSGVRKRLAALRSTLLTLEET